MLKRTLCPIALVFALAAIFSTAGIARAQAPNVTGLWVGTSRVLPPCFFSSGRCNAVNKITFNLTQNGDHLKGKYTCAYGNQICRKGGMDNTGKVVGGRVESNQVRISIVIPNDVSNCYFNGMIYSGTSIRGGYSCYQGGELIEEGNWDVQRAPQ
jgi:hypothetical protein